MAVVNRAGLARNIHFDFFAWTKGCHRIDESCDPLIRVVYEILCKESKIKTHYEGTKNEFDSWTKCEQFSQNIKLEYFTYITIRLFH